MSVCSALLRVKILANFQFKDKAENAFTKMSPEGGQHSATHKIDAKVEI